ncbi:glycosyltransferase family 2 protein [Profundibacterium mesophilum]|uniref:DNA polymerase III subunit gamma and tau n=1 Tax=Profundibacterium mesophilum KAUST100406-0324 TaxID=1037889 RepID=A0A921NW78_9RHOB|nr:glycosyltransferase family 2 protein [Profundibacterium mesophilum]KAF0676803.1 DNA polymerase III subunit gamma and tau [Profundibacterium mesophilum KAUST100406-0324]
MQHARPQGAAPRGVPRPARSRHGRVTAVSMMKDEGPYLLEWVAHHLAVGFTDLLVYTNDCTDGTDEMLIRLEALGLAHHRRNVIPKGIKPQPSAIRHAQEEPLVAESDWVLVLDADEFVCIRYADGTLDPMLDAVVAAGAGGIVMTWRIFGSAGRHEWSRDFVTEQYLRAAPMDWNKGWGVKTLFRHDPERWKLGIHRPKMRNKVLDTDYPASVHWLNGSGLPMEEYFKFRGWRSIQRTVGYDWVQVNHYAVKSIDAYAIRKLRGNVNAKKDKYNADYWALQDRNETQDMTMLRYGAARRAIFEGLLRDPVLGELHRGAVGRIEARLAELRRSAGYAALVAELSQASRLPIAEAVATPPKARDPERIAALMSRVRERGAARPPAPRGPEGPPSYRCASPQEGMDARLAGTGHPTPPLTWHHNHGVALPADPARFTPPALAQIAQGKFERNIARNFPKLVPAGGTYLELAPASGLVASLLALGRPGPDAADEADAAVAAGPAHIGLCGIEPGMRDYLEMLWSKNALPSPRWPVIHEMPPGGQGPVDALRAALGACPAPSLLVLGAPALCPDALGQVLGDAAPAAVALAGPLWEGCASRQARFEQVFAATGLRRRLPIDPALAAVYDRGIRGGQKT